MYNEWCKIEMMKLEDLMGDALWEEITRLMKLTYDTTSPHYSCLRPPGPAGALILPSSKANKDPSNYVAGVFGYVSPPEGSPSCKELGECDIVDGHCIRTVHAEVNAVVAAAHYGVKVNEGVIFSVLKPCYNCSKVLIQAGIKTIYYAGIAYDDEATSAMLRRAELYSVYVDIDLPYGKKEPK